MAKKHKKMGKGNAPGQNKKNYPKEGTLINISCNGFNRQEKIADGNGGSYWGKVIAYNAPECGYVAPKPEPIPEPTPEPEPTPVEPEPVEPTPEPQPQPLPVETYQGRLVPNAFDVYHRGKADGNIMQFYDGGLDPNKKARWLHEFGNKQTVSVIFFAREAEKVKLNQVRMYDSVSSLQAGQHVEYWLKEYGSNTLKKIAVFTGSQYNRWTETPIIHSGYVEYIEQRKVLNNPIVPIQIEWIGEKAVLQEDLMLKKKRYSLKEKIGVNSYLTDFIKPASPGTVTENRLLAAAPYHHVRIYLDTYNFAREGQYKFNPSFNGWFYDPTFKALTDQGKFVLATVKNIPLDMMNSYPEGYRDMDNSPLYYHAPYMSTLADGSTDYFNEWYYVEKELEESYYYYKNFVIQFTARYGRNKNPNVDTSGHVLTGRGDWDTFKNETLFGLGTVQGIELLNEMDKTWDGEKGYMSPAQYAVFFVTCARAIKNIDPTMQVWPGGIVGAKAEYFKAIADYCKYKGYQIAGLMDCLNVHLYFNNVGGEQYAGARTGAAPELAGAGEKIKALTKVANLYFEGIPVHMTETGYDVQLSTQAAQPILNELGTVAYDAKQAQGIYCLRTLFYSDMTGVDIVDFYELFDNDNASLSTKIYQTCGHVEHVTEGMAPQFRAAANMLFAVGQTFPNYRYKRTISEGAYYMLEYSFGIESIFIIWLPVDVDLKLNVNVSVGWESAQILSFNLHNPAFSIETKATTGGTLNLNGGIIPKIIRKA